MRPLRLKHARRNISVARDAHGVPHVQADSWLSALYGLGFMHAVDRPTQMLFARAVTSGRSAELIADRPELFETDRFFRRAGLYVHLEDEVRNLDDRMFNHLTAYCEGVNDGMKQAGRTLPMWATRFHPEPWDQKSVLLIGCLLSYGGLLVSQLQNERLLIELIQAGVDEDKLRELFSPRLDGVDFAPIRQIHMSNQLSDQALELITDLPRLAGSNAWAVAPQRSATGAALLASDPHLEIHRLPAIWYEIVLQWNGQYVMGASLPGCPLLGVGRTRDLAWGTTFMKGDTCDYFIEDCRQNEAGGWQYRRGDEWRDFSIRAETVARKNGESEQVQCLYNNVGTLETDPIPGQPGYYLNVAWIGQGAGAARSIGIWLDLIASKSVKQGMKAVEDCPHPTLCWVLADSDGHIGLQAGGWHPQRPDHYTGLLPVGAWDERNHWQGRRAVDQLPRIYDPPEGFVATANENINAEGGPLLISMLLPDYRKRRIVERLQQIPLATVEDMQALQYDVVSLQARDLLAIFLPELPDSPIKRKLDAWDCNFSPESTEATLFTKLYRNVLLEVFGHAPRGDLGIGWRRMLYLCTRAGYATMVLTCFDRLMRKEDSLWWTGRHKGTLIRRAAALLEEEPDQTWGEMNSFRFTNRFFGAEKLGRALGFHSPPLGMPGCHATPFQGHLLTTHKKVMSFAPSYHFVTDLQYDEAWTNLPGGASESGFSKFYKNDVRRWRTGVYKRVTPQAKAE